MGEAGGKVAGEVFGWGVRVEAGEGVAEPY